MLDAEVQRAVSGLEQGRISAAGEFVLASGATSTVVTARLCSASSAVLLMAKDAAAAALGVLQVVPAKGSFTVFHPSAATVRTFRYAAFTPT